jgi:ABC-type multidrug transport system ATPase subunit
MIGVRKETVEDVVTNTMARFDLTDHANTKAGVLSGGNKRKLCCA